MREQALLAGTPEGNGVPGLRELSMERSRTLGKPRQPGRRTDEIELSVCGHGRRTSV